MIGPSLNLVEIAKNVTGGQTDVIRKNAEQELHHIVFQFPNEFMEIACSEFLNKSLSPGIRMTIATFLKVALRPRNQENFKSIWEFLRPEIREQAKSTAVGCLIDPAEQVRKSAANLTATIFVCDLVSDNSWSSLLQTLADNILNPQPQIKRTAIETLGYICDILYFDKIFNLGPDKIHALLTGICAGLNSYSEISNTAVLALCNSLEFLQRELDKADLREYIFNVLIEILISSGKNNDLETTRNTLLCLGEISKMVFLNFETYAAVVIEKVLDCYKIPDESILTAVNEFFMKLIRAENFHHTSYFALEWKNIAIKAIELLVIRTEKTEMMENEDCLNVIVSIIHLLSTVNLLRVKDSFALYEEFIRGFITSDFPNQKLSALLVFESLLENTDRATIDNFLGSSFMGLIGYLKTEAHSISFSCAVILRKIAQYHPYIYLNDNNLEMTLIAFKELLSIRQHDEKIIKTKKCICSCLQIIAENSHHSNLANSQFAIFMDGFFELFFQLAQSTSDLSFVEYIFSTTFALIQHQLDKRSHSPYFQSFNQLLNTVEVFKGDPQIRKTMIEDIFMNMNAILTKMVHWNIPMETPNIENFRYLDEVYHNVIKIFESYNEIISEGLALMACIINYSHSHFFQYVETFMQKYVKPTLLDPNNHELFKVGLESVSCICKRFPKNFKNYIEEMVAFILKNLQDISIKRTLKISMFMVLGDFAMSCPEPMTSHVSSILHLCDMALSASLNFMESNIAEDHVYAIELRDSIFDCYFCIIHGVPNFTSIRPEDLETSFSKIQNYIEVSCRKENEPHPDYLKICIALLVDFCSVGISLNNLNRRLLGYLYSVLNNGPKDPDLQELLNYVHKNFESSILQ